MPDHQQVQRFYDDVYYAGKPGASAVPWHMRVIAKRLGLSQGDMVLDIACGTGDWLAELQRHGAKVSGVDISARAVERARQRLHDADIREGVAEQLPFDDKRFDIVTCMGSLEHFLDQPRALQEMRRVAKLGARFLILVPNAGFLSRRLGLYRGTGQVAIRETVRPISEWVGMFGAAGLVVSAKWRDLHPLSTHWICRGPVWAWLIRAVQACALALWPIGWQYQVYFLCRAREG
ncbi:MAG: methyltransferase domain-containing protein [Xanthomonadales bacterium]|nr:methyltransferase domain-containing protein [Xanthomonadales bacterium]